MAGAQTLADLKFKKADFQNLDLPTLMMKIWTYSHMHNYCDYIVPGTYRSRCIDELKTMWQDTWLDFDLVVKKLCILDEEWKFVAKRTEKNIEKLYKKLEGALYD